MLRLGVSALAPGANKPYGSAKPWTGLHSRRLLSRCFYNIRDVAKYCSCMRIYVLRHWHIAFYLSKSLTDHVKRSYQLEREAAVMAWLTVGPRRSRQIK